MIVVIHKGRTRIDAVNAVIITVIMQWQIDAMLATLDKLSIVASCPC